MVRRLTHSFNEKRRRRNVSLLDLALDSVLECLLQEYGTPDQVFIIIFVFKLPTSSDPVHRDKIYGFIRM